MKIDNTSTVTYQRRLGARLSACAALLLAGCGAGEAPPAVAPALLATPSNTVVAFDLTPPPLSGAAGAFVAKPMFDLAPALLDAPDGRDAQQPNESAHRRPSTLLLSPEQRQTVTRRLTVQAIRQGRIFRPVGDDTGAPALAQAAPMASASVVATYTPAQIRAAYGMPALPALTSALSAAQKAQLGAGQTIYIVDAMHDPNVAAELAAFNAKFGLPTCTAKVLAAGQTLPLAAAGATCELVVAYNTSGGGITNTVPAYDAGWATEIALDVQWAHATAPLARIVLIEAADASLDSLLGGVKLANAMGPGAVSMSFGALEGNYTAAVDAAFSNTKMTYLAATGDSGSAVSWPSVSPNVLAVGGTTLTYTGSGTRSEVAWSGTGGGVSAYTPTPAYQNSTVPGVGSPVRRTVADVAFNADPSSGQYVAVIASGSTTVNWVSAGGTSLSTPQWAGLIAVANAQRAVYAKPALGPFHATVYGQVAAVPGLYASAFADITQGANGGCVLCVAKTGYDAVAGLGTPNVGKLMDALTGVVAAPVAPVVSSASISGKVGSALSFTVAVSAANPVSYSMTGAPAGMTISSAGLVAWPTPLAGSYAVTVSATDTKTGLTGKGSFAITVAPPAPPVVSAAAISGKVGTALSFTVVVSAPNPVIYSLVGAPAGMTINTSGTVSWPTPVAGTYRVTIVAKDSKTGLSGQGVTTVAIAAPVAPVVTVAAITGKPGVALSFSPTVVAANPVVYSLSGAPAGMSINSTSGVVSWASPVVGSYSVTLIAKDGKTGLSGQAVASVKISVAGPVITAAPMTGVAGKPMSGTISFAAPGSTSLQVAISGIPMGMALSMSGMTITATWPNPVAGSYTLAVTATDSAGLTAKVNVPVTITAK